MGGRRAGAFAQQHFRYRLDWGRDGIKRAVARGDALVVVDVLSFSTTTAIAVHQGAQVYACAIEGGEAQAIALREGAEVAVRRGQVPKRGRFSLSPVTVRQAKPGDKIVLQSPNGATCAAAGSGAPVLLVGALVNAQAVARTLAQTLDRAALEAAVTVVACGERWPRPGIDGPLRVAVEDLFGAGAILANLPGGRSLRSPEARAAQAAWTDVAGDVLDVLATCHSGSELCDRGYQGDVEHAAMVDAFPTAPIQRGGCFCPA